VSVDPAPAAEMLATEAWPAADLPPRPEGLAEAGRPADSRVDQGVVGGITADRVEVGQGIVGGVMSGEVRVGRGIVGGILADRVSIAQGGAARIVAGDVSIEQGGAGAIAGWNVRLGHGSFAGAVVGARIDGDVRALLDWRGVLAVALAVIGIAWLRRGR
jgi:hypothetical protein